MNHPELKDLTETQLDCLRLALEKKSSVEIGSKLNLSTKCVETILNMALHKLGASNLVEAARLLREVSVEEASDGPSDFVGPFAAARSSTQTNVSRATVKTPDRWQMRLIWILIIALGSAIVFGLLLGLLSLWGIGL